jgi:16S rRNA (guanine527-N7)-methyltransferase
MVATEPPPGKRTPANLDRTLAQAANALGLNLPPGFTLRTQTYLDELERWQRIGSLTAYRDRAARVQHLVLESLMLLTVLPIPAAPLVDIGSGAGVPGLILKLAQPEWEVVLIEAARRRANFLRHVVRKLGLDAVNIHWNRAEVLADRDLSGRFQTVTMRAVASGGVARALAHPFLAPNGSLVMPVGPQTVPESGSRREVALVLPGQLPWRRQFLIIPRKELDADVPRGTRRAAQPQHRGRKPEGRRRENHERR